MGISGQNLRRGGEDAAEQARQNGSPTTAGRSPCTILGEAHKDGKSHADNDKVSAHLRQNRGAAREGEPCINRGEIITSLAQAARENHLARR